MLPEPKVEPSLDTDTSFQSVSGDGVALALSKNQRQITAGSRSNTWNRSSPRPLTATRTTCEKRSRTPGRRQFKTLEIQGSIRRRSECRSPRATSTRLTGEDLPGKSWGMVGRLVGNYGKLAIRGIEAAYMRAIDEGDGGSWLAYATATCKKLYEEREA